MTRREFKDFCRTSRIAIKELVTEGYFTLSDPVGVCQMIDNLSESQISDLATSMLMLSEKDNANILSQLFTNKLSINPELPIHVQNEKQFYQNLEEVLMEDASSEENKEADKIVELITKGWWRAAAAMIVTGAFLHPARMLNNLTIVKAKLGNKWGEFVKVYPAATYVDVKLRQGGGWLDAQARKDITAWQKQIEKADPKKIGKAALKGSLLAAGLVGLSIATIQIYDKFLSAAARSCRGAKSWKDKKICILRHKIAGCETVINKLKQELPNCNKHVNPEKCTHSINSKIWNWTRRRDSYEKKIARLSSEGSDNSKSFKYIKR